jgi:hypothetical protein
VVSGDPEHEYQARFEKGIPRAVTILENLIARLEEKRADRRVMASRELRLRVKVWSGIKPETLAGAPWPRSRFRLT